MSIPAQISASRALARGERYTGAVDASGMERLADLSPSGISADFSLRADVGRRQWLEGRVAGQVELVCQVCLEPFAWAFDAPVALALAGNEEEEERLMADCEPLLVKDDQLFLHEIIEEEILLALPLMPRCPACENARPLAQEPLPQVETKRPLAGLKNLKLKGIDPARRK